MSDILPITSNQDFFGGSIIEAMYCETTPLLPKRLTYPELFQISYCKITDLNYQESFLIVSGLFGSLHIILYYLGSSVIISDHFVEPFKNPPGSLLDYFGSF